MSQSLLRLAAIAIFLSQASANAENLKSLEDAHTTTDDESDNLRAFDLGEAEDEEVIEFDDFPLKKPATRPNRRFVRIMGKPVIYHGRFGGESRRIREERPAKPNRPQKHPLTIEAPTTEIVDESAPMPAFQAAISTTELDQAMINGKLAWASFGGGEDAEVLIGSQHLRVKKTGNSMVRFVDEADATLEEEENISPANLVVSVEDHEEVTGIFTGLIAPHRREFIDPDSYWTQNTEWEETI